MTQPVRPLEELKPPEIRQALRELMAEAGSAENYQMVNAVAERLGSARPSGADLTYTGRQVDEQFIGRVKRGLDWLVDSGELLKTSKGDRTPAGDLTWRTSVYYTHEAYTAALQEGEQKKAAKQENRRRWNEVKRVLQRRHGIVMVKDGEIPVGDWESLLDIGN